VTFSRLLLCTPPLRMTDWRSNQHTQGVAYIEDIDKLHPGPLLGDRGRLRQVIANGISNAAKFTDAGSVTFRVRQIDETPTSIRLQFAVLDTGCGIPAAVLPTLFQPFRQADSSTARRYGGTGLGLTISRELMALMGGTIELDSEEGMGTAMVVTVWLDKDLQAQTNPDSEPGPHVIINHGGSSIADFQEAEGSQSYHDPADTQQSKRKPERRPQEVTILVAEDNELLRILLVKMLAKLKFNVVAVEDGALAVEEVHQRKVDLILMDGQMPVKDGYQATRDIRADPDPLIASIPIVALTASAFKGDRERCLDAGMSCYLSKPARSQEIEQVIWGQLGRRDAALASQES